MKLLGKKPPLLGVDHPKLANFAKRALPPPPPTVDRYTGVRFQMFCNDTIGDCTVAAIANTIVQRTTLAQGVAVVMPDATAIQIYSHITGYDPAKPETDQGAVETDVLNWFAKEGFSLRAQSLEIGTWAALDGTPDQVKQCVNLFGSAYIGLALPLSAQYQPVWDAPVTSVLAGDFVPGSWGGHAVAIVGYDSAHAYIATWGGLQAVTWAFLRVYMDESYAVFSPGEWLNTTGLSPSHFDFAALAAAHGDLSA